MEATIDSVGRIVVPKALRDALGLGPGTRVDLSLYGAGIQLIPAAVPLGSSRSMADSWPTPTLSSPTRTSSG